MIWKNGQFEKYDVSSPKVVPKIRTVIAKALMSLKVSEFKTLTQIWQSQNEKMLWYINPTYPVVAFRSALRLLLLGGMVLRARMIKLKITMIRRNDRTPRLNEVGMSSERVKT